MYSRGESRAPRGAAAVELACVLPLLLLLLVGMLELGRLIEGRHILTAASREGGRQAMTGRMTAAGVEQAMRDYLDEAGMPTANLDVHVENLNAPGVDPTNAVQFDSIQIKLSLPYQDIGLLMPRLFTSEATRIYHESVWYSTRDRPYPDPAEPDIE